MLDQAIFQKARGFVDKQLPYPCEVVPLTPGTGHFSFRPITLVVSLAPDWDFQGADYSNSVCTLFHEYGHWLHMIKWADENSVSAEEMPTGTPNGFFPYFRSKRYLDGCESLIPDPGTERVAFEKEAWNLGYSGLPLERKTYPGLKQFLNDLDVCTRKKRIF